VLSSALWRVRRSFDRHDVSHHFGPLGLSLPEHYSHDDGVLCGTVTCLIVAFSAFMFSATMQDRRGFSPEPRSSGARWSTFLAERLVTAGADCYENMVIQWSLLLLYCLRFMCGTYLYVVGGFHL
jgi:hypothetical protein